MTGVHLNLRAGAGVERFSYNQALHKHERKKQKGEAKELHLMMAAKLTYHYANLGYLAFLKEAVVVRVLKRTDRMSQTSYPSGSGAPAAPAAPADSGYHANRSRASNTPPGSSGLPNPPQSG